MANLITSLKNTMGDQGPTNAQFYKQLAEFREELLPTVMANWETMTKEMQDEIAELCKKIYCKMHLLVNFATECFKRSRRQQRKPNNWH